MCPRCGRPQPGRADIPDMEGADQRHTAKSSSTPVWLIGCAAIGCGGVVLIGILAAIAIPKFSNVVKMAGQSEADMLLTQAYQAEVDYHRGAGGYTADLARFNLRPGNLFTLSVSQATESELCVEATPKPDQAVELEARSIDETGYVHTGPGCRDQMDQADSTGVTVRPRGGTELEDVPLPEGSQPVEGTEDKPAKP